MKHGRFLRLRTLIAASGAVAAGAILGGGLFAAVPTFADAADAYPTKPITMVVPWSPGGTSDTAARVLADLIENQRGWSIKVENRPGAGSAVGLQLLANAKADGYTFGLTTSSLITNPIIGESAVNYTMFEPVRLTHFSPGGLAVRADAPWKTLEEFLAQARANPKRVRLGNNGTGSTWHLLANIIEDQTGVELVGVPYKGGGEQLAALLGGHIEAGIQSVAGWLPSVKSGQLRVLGASAESRMEEAPDLPTFKEQGVDVTYGLFVGFLLPKGAPQDARDALSSALSEAVHSEKFTKFAAANAMVVLDQGPEAFAQRMKKEDAYIRNLAKKYFSK